MVEFAASHLPHDILERVLAADGSTSGDDVVDVVISARTVTGTAAEISWSFVVRTQVNVPDAVALPQLLGRDHPALGAAALAFSNRCRGRARHCPAAAQAQTGTAPAASAPPQAQAAAVAPEVAAGTPASDRAADRADERAAQVASLDAERQAELAERRAERAQRRNDAES